MVILLVGSMLMAVPVAVEECSLPDLVLAGTPFEVFAPADLSLSRAGQALLTSFDGKSLSLLEGCAAKPLALDGSAEGMNPYFTAAGGNTLYQGVSGWKLGSLTDKPRPIDLPAKHPEARGPILSNDGKSVAWVVHDLSIAPRFIKDRGSWAVPQVLVRALDTGAETLVPFPAGTLANVDQRQLPRLLAVDTKQKEVTVAVEDVAAGTAIYLGVGFEGAVRWGPIVTAGLAAGPGESASFRRVGPGWLAWGDYTNIKNTPLTLSWSLPSGIGTHRVVTPKMPAQHPHIDGAAISPDAQYVAVSVGLGTRLKLSSARTYVFRISDGAIVFDRKHGVSNGGPVAFLGNDRFCFTEYDAKKQRHATHVFLLKK